MPIPHDFPSLVDGPNQVVLIAGTGLSTPDCPTLKELKTDLDRVASTLGVNPHDDEYKLAEAVLDKIEADGKSESQSRLWLAEALGMLDDRRWFGEIGLPLSGNTPRHRVLARFVVEERLRAIVSLNWDALLETALDSVGLTEWASLPRPWKVTRYARVVDNTHMPLLAHADVFPVIKPHGCVRELERLRDQFRSGNTSGSVTFKLKSSELSSLNPDQDNAISNNVKDLIAKCPLLGIGWRASEGYLRKAIVEVAQQVQRSEVDAFSLIDLEWNADHSDIAAAYGKNESKSFAQVSKEANPSTDCLMQWLQARHALKRMIAMVPSSEQAPLVQILQEFDQPNCDHPVLSWADCWLPTWVRICWRAGAMQGFDRQTNKPIGPYEMPVTPRDAHIPLTGMSNDRRDLHAAAKLLAALPKPLNRFRFDLYPGGILDMNKQCLYIPLPGWKASVPSSDLAALKPLVEALKGLGFVNKISLLLLNNQDDQPDISLRRQLEAQFRRQMPLTSFASGKAVSWVDLEELRVD
ncbi:MAG: hypothetical protein BMS9Abin08_0759 [Gammaproteobacteria bacterium]|nr:MAG: hypothetical protein BMS9Abin08_0759 [Gammaproteobacteria bacterium]